MRKTKLLTALLGVAAAVAATSTPSAAVLPSSGVEVVVGRAPVPARLPESLATALTIAEAYARQHPHDVAHPWADVARGAVVVPVVRDGGLAVASSLRARLAGLSGVVTTTGTRSYARLEDIENAAVDLAYADVPGADAILATYTDARTNRVVVETNAAPSGLLSVLARRFGADAVVVRSVPGAVRLSAQARHNDTSPFYGGAVIHVPGGGDCTTGFPWERFLNQRVITAGHCVPNGGSVSTPSQSMGSVTSGSGENWNDGTGTVYLSGQSTYRGDIARIDSSYSVGWSIYVGGVNSNTFKDIENMAWRRNAVGDSYCTGGAVSGELCGWTVSATGVNVATDKGTARNVSVGTKTSPCTARGDSGAPVYGLTGTRVTAMGIHNAGSQSGTTCTQSFTDIWNVWDAFGGFVAIPPTVDGDRRTSTQHLQSRHMLRSPNTSYTLEMQIDGNLVLYKPGRVAVWSTGTRASNNEGAYAVMQNDGNFVMYRPGGTAVWSTGTAGRTGAYIRLQDDCNLVVYTSGGTAVWASNTANC